MTDDLPLRVREFVSQHIRTVGKLEVLLLLCRDREKAWTAREVSQYMRSNQSYAESQLNELAKQGLVKILGTGDGAASENQYLFSCEPELNELVTELAMTYVKRRVSIISFIYSQPSEPIRSLADAFKLRKE